MQHNAINTTVTVADIKCLVSLFIANYRFRFVSVVDFDYLFLNV